MSAAVRAALRDWVVARNPGLDPAALTDHTPLVSGRLVTSLQVVELLLLLEELRGQPIDPDCLVPGAFADVDTIARTFIPGDTPYPSGGPA